MRRSASVAALGLVLVLAGCASSDARPAPPAASPPAASAPDAPTTSPPTTSLPTTEPTSQPIVRGEPPQHVRIPAIDLDAPLIDLGIAPNGQMEAPVDYDEVGWFTGGGRPGGYGPTVIAAHVDSPTGPAVFLRLHELAEGDSVEVTDSAGTVFRYSVTAVADYPKSAFPTQQVFGAVAADELRLITCGGVFDSAAASYVDNRVVYAVRTGV
nr:class F sortase [uncultured Microbacterium sp.]